MILTKEQRKSLKNVFDRAVILKTTIGQIGTHSFRDTRPMTYREFRRTAVPAVADTCLMVPWQGMWLGIEPDGYTHS